MLLKAEKQGKIYHEAAFSYKMFECCVIIGWLPSNIIFPMVSDSKMIAYIFKLHILNKLVISYTYLKIVLSSMHPLQGFWSGNKCEVTQIYEKALRHKSEWLHIYSQFKNLSKGALHSAQGIPHAENEHSTLSRTAASVMFFPLSFRMRQIRGTTTETHSFGLESPGAVHERSVLINCRTWHNPFHKNTDMFQGLVLL